MGGRAHDRKTILNSRFIFCLKVFLRTSAARLVMEIFWQIRSNLSRYFLRIAFVRKAPLTLPEDSILPKRSARGDRSGSCSTHPLCNSGNVLSLHLTSPASWSRNGSSWWTFSIWRDLDWLNEVIGPFAEATIRTFLPASGSNIQKMSSCICHPSHLLPFYSE
jgi:hypothetical protein